MPVLLRPAFAVAIVYLSLTAAAAWAESRDDAKKLPASADLRPDFERWGLERRDQGARPTCSVFSVVGALEFAAAKAKNRGERLSVEFLNWASNQAVGRDQDGGFFSDMWRGFAQYGICPETEMPYQKKFEPANPPGGEAVTAAKSKLELGLRQNWIKRWNVKTGLKDEEFAEIKRTLSQGWPVCSGLRWPHREKWQDDVLQMCPPEGVYDGHSILLVGYRDDDKQAGGGVFIFRNTNRGGRDGYMPYEYAKAYMNDAVWIESPKPADNPAKAADGAPLPRQ